jgi:hypothetical protein|tara:strand:+ start:14353 stop:14511 length:159 start_codon:yes stop_codon:yes gene_type:complete
MASAKRKNIEGFPGYQIDINGNVWSKFKNKWGLGSWRKLKGSVCQGSYYPLI